MRMRRRRHESGQGLVELAVTLPMLIVILLGLAHFGLILQTQQVITNASRIGARVGTQPGGSVSSIQSAVSNYCQQAGLDPSKVSTQVNIDTTASQATVTVTYQFSSPFGTVLPAIAQLIRQSNLVMPSQLQATTVMRL